MNTKKKPAKKRHHEVTAYDSKGQIVPTKATVAVPRPKKRTAGVEVVRIKRFIGRYQLDDVIRGASFMAWSRSDSPRDIKVTITLHIPKRRSSK